MLALRWHGRGDVRLDVVEPPPQPGPGEVQVRVAWCGICGTDVEEYRSGPHFIPVERANELTGGKAPITLGHEFAGVVEAVGAGVEDLRVGDRVAVDTLVFCGECYWCRRHQIPLCERLAALGLMADGGLAALCNAPAYSCLPLPDGVSFEAGALAETLSVAVRALRRGRFEIGERVAIVGAGAIGLMALQAARAGGAAEVAVVEPHASRRVLAERLGATAVLTPDAASPLGADLVVECSGNPRAIETAVAHCRKGGRVVLVGIYGEPVAFDFLRVVTAERELIGSLSHVYDEDFAAAIALLTSGSVVAEPLVTGRVPIARALEDGLLSLANHPDDHVKILIAPDPDGMRP